jgi:ribosomal protein S18 acetylase RimI-like enzyme
MGKTPSTPSTLKRESAGRYMTVDRRFAVEQASGGWMVTDAAHANELGMPLVRGPFATLAGAKAAVEAARDGPAPVSDLAARLARAPVRAGTRARDGDRRQLAGAESRPPGPAPHPAPEPAPEPAPPPVEIRAWRRSDGPALRALWAAFGLVVVGDEDDDLATMARRNPGLLLVATQGGTIVGSALGGWDGRRGWIYHVAIAASHHRQGIGRRLVERVEAGLRALGCRRVNAIVMDHNESGAAFWRTMGYEPLEARRYGREL